jgi:hypothetical protein
MKALLRLYPSAWRSRYGPEVGELLEARRSRWSDAHDLIVGALDAHLHPTALGLTAQDEGRSTMPMLRLAGRAAMLGGSLWLLAYVGVALVALIARGQPRGMGPGEGTVFILALVFAPVCFLVALVSIVRCSAGRHRTLAMVGALLPAAGAVVMALGLLANAVLPDRPLVTDVDTWEWWTAGMVGLVLGCVAYAIVIWATGSVSRRAAAVLLVGSIANAGILLTGTAGIVTEMRSIAVAASGAMFGIGWIAVGIDALGRHRASAVADGAPTRTATAVV